MAKTSFILTAGVSLIVLGACSSVGNAISGERRTPDEFKVVTKAPLSVPPEYSLRPPNAGQALPGEVVANSDRAVSFGQDFGADASASEKLLVRSAGAIAVNPIIRSQVDFEEAGIIRKDPAFSDRVVSWQGTDEEQSEATDDSATGGEAVTISGKPSVKLPGT